MPEISVIRVHFLDSTTPMPSKLQTLLSSRQIMSVFLMDPLHKKGENDPPEIDTEDPQPSSSSYQRMEEDQNTETKRNPENDGKVETTSLDAQVLALLRVIEVLILSEVENSGKEEEEDYSEMWAYCAKALDRFCFLAYMLSSLIISTIYMNMIGHEDRSDK